MALTTGRGSGGSSGKRNGSAEKFCCVSHIRLPDESHLSHHYGIAESLGQGTFGIVHLAIHKDSKSGWACKTVNKDKAGSANIKLLEREVSILKRVRHEHIICLREVLETSKKMFLIMELCSRGELADLLKKKKKFTEKETRTVMLRLADAISYLHKNDTVHRDLKLENILLAGNEKDPSDELYIKITDFGLSVQKGGSGHEDMMMDQCGTPIYMSPEILRNNTYSEKCDIWAMGVIMFLLLSGSAPYNATNQDDLLNVVMDKKLEDIVKEYGLQKICARARDCMSGMLTCDPVYRLTANEILDHPWLSEKPLGTETQRQPNVLELMKEYNNDEKSGKIDGKSTTSQPTKKLTSRNSNNNIAPGKCPASTKRAFSANNVVPRSTSKR